MAHNTVNDVESSYMTMTQEERDADLNMRLVAQFARIKTKYSVNDLRLALQYRDKNKAGKLPRQDVSTTLIY